MNAKLFCLLLTACSILHTPQPEYYENVFQSNVYQAYATQLEALATQFQNNSAPHTLFEQEGIAFIHFITHSPQNNQRLFHKEMISRLRILLEMPYSDSPLSLKISSFLDQLCTWMFTSVDLREATQDFFEQEIAGVAQLDSSHLSIGEIAGIIHTDISQDPRFSSHVSHKKENPYLSGDLPSILFTVNETPIVRMANVTDATAQIIPEFRHYLRAQAAEGKCHLYINLMRRIEDEASKSTLIEDLEQEKKLGLYVVTLDRNSESAFYLQNGVFAELNAADAFKNVFLLQLFEGPHAFWSRHLNKAYWKERCGVIIDTVHARYFQNRTALSVEERQDFIEIAYVKIVEALISEIQPAVVNISCKESLDRGPSLYTLLYIDQPEFDVRIAMTLLFAPPVLYHNRASHHLRIARFQTAATRIATLKNTKK